MATLVKRSNQSGSQRKKIFSEKSLIKAIQYTKVKTEIVCLSNELKRRFEEYNHLYSEQIMLIEPYTVKRKDGFSISITNDLKLVYNYRYHPAIEIPTVFMEDWMLPLEELEAIKSALQFFAVNLMAIIDEHICCENEINF